jgi:hypothetical protein
MPFGIGLDVILVLLCGVHAVRTGRPYYWLYILFAVPFLGSLIYIFAEWLPASRGAQQGLRRAHRAVGRAIDPGRDVREAQLALELAPTVDNRLRLANALLDVGDAKGAVLEFRRCLDGPHSSDIKIHLGLASALLASNEPVDAAQAVEAFQASYPGSVNAALSLIYARALAAAGRPEAEAAFEHLVATSPDIEVKCRFADWLRAQGKHERAQAFYREILATSRHWQRHTRQFNREWLSRAEAGLRN